MNRNHQYSSDFVRYVVDMAAFDSARSLKLLNAIEATVQSNDTLRETFQQIAHQTHKLTEIIYSLNSRSEEHILDESNEIRRSLETAMAQLSSMAADLTQRRAHAINDPSLQEADGVVESFNLVLEAITEAHESLNEVNWAVMEHEADVSPLSGKGPFKSAKDLIASLD